MEQNLVTLDEELITRLSVKFCTDYLPSSVSTFLLSETLKGKTYSDGEVNAINSFIQHVAENWIKRLQKIEQEG